MFSSSWSRGPAFRRVVSLARWLVWWREPKCRCTNSPPPRTLRRRGCAALETWDLYKMDLTMTSQPEFGVWGWAWNRTGYRLMNVFLVGFGDTSQSDSHHPAGKTWGRESATINEDSIGYFEAFPCPVTVSKRFSYYTDPPKWCTMKSRFIFLIKGLRQFGNT